VTGTVIPFPAGRSAEQHLAERPALPVQNINSVLDDPKQRAAYAYHEAALALRELLDTSDRPWADVLMLVRRLAEDRGATELHTALDGLRHGVWM